LSSWGSDVATNPTAESLARQIIEAFPWDTAPDILIRDNDGAYAKDAPLVDHDPPKFKVDE
jgi:hypothetical protein